MSLATTDPDFNERCYKALGTDVGLFWRFIYHGYTAAPETAYPNVEKLKAIRAKYAPHASLWQGENGAPSEMPGDGLALNHIAWSEITQAKWDLRRMLGDYVRGIPSSVSSEWRPAENGPSAKGARSDPLAGDGRPHPSVCAADVPRYLLAGRRTMNAASRGASSSA